MSVLKVGDLVERMVAGRVAMTLEVTQIEPDRIRCGPWSFHPQTGGEIDIDLGWDGIKTGSYIKIPQEETPNG